MPKKHAQIKKSKNAKKTAKKSTTKKKSTKKTKTDIIIAFVLDRSASMSVRRDATISAMNEYVESQQKDAKKKKETVLFTLTQFNQEVSISEGLHNISKFATLNRDSYVPSGITALRDATGDTIKHIEIQITSKPKWKKIPPAILVVIMTDGAENASRKYSQSALKEMIDSKQKDGNWSFVYLAADQSAWDAGMSLGISAQNLASYDVNNIGGSIGAVSARTISYRKSVAKGVMCSNSFFDGNEAGDENLVRGIDLTNSNSSENENHL